MEAQQLEYDFTNTPAFVLKLTGNPWTDFGIVSFCRALEHSHFIETLNLTAYEAILTIQPDARDNFVEWLNDQFRERCNALHWFSRGAKILELTDFTYDDAGFIQRTSVPLTESDLKQIKELWKNSPLKDEMPLTQWRFNFIGTSTDAAGFRKKQQALLNDFMADYKGSTGKQVCAMSGQPSAKLKPLLQVVNPFASKHQNTRVRGVHGSAVNPQVGSLYYMLSLSATLDEHIPFVYDPAKQITRLILPEIPNLALLSKVYARLRRNLKDNLRQGKDELYPYTNLRTRMHLPNRYSLAISLFHNIFYAFTAPAHEQTKGRWDFSPIDAHPTKIVKQLTRWIVIPFTKGQNVIFQSFHAVEVDVALYKYVQPIPFESSEIRLVPDILERMTPSTPDGENALGQLSQAIATSTPALMKIALFNLWKHNDGVTIYPEQGVAHPARQLQHFVNHFLEVNEVLNEELREDLRAFGTTIGKSFYEDVTLISKLFNISSVNDFTAALNTVMFRLYKKFGTNNAAKGGVAIKQERMDRILNKLSEENCKQVAETLSIYVCLNAYNTKLFASKSENQGDENE